MIKNRTTFRSVFSIQKISMKLEAIKNKAMMLIRRKLKKKNQEDPGNAKLMSKGKVVELITRSWKRSQVDSWKKNFLAVKTLVIMRDLI